MTNTWRRPEEYELAAMQSNWRVPAIRIRQSATHKEPHAQAGPVGRATALGVERILRLRKTPERDGVHWSATVFGVHGVRDITWWGEPGSAGFEPGQLIRSVPHVASFPADRNGSAKAGTFLVTRVSHLSQIDPDINLLETVPLSWLPEAGGGQGVNWVERFDDVWSRLSRPMRAWFNALFWLHPWRLFAFLTAPASMKHHHARKYGLFIHSVDCAWRALTSAQQDRFVDMEVLAMAALLHDVGKSAEYDWNVHRQQWQLSDRGALMGHRLTCLEWMAAGRAALPEDSAPDELSAVAVYHAIHACHAPDWVGLRSPRTPEAFYLASVDALSGHCDLIEAHAIPNRSKGRYHPAFRGGAFVVSGAGRGVV